MPLQEFLEAVNQELFGYESTCMERMTEQAAKACVGQYIRDNDRGVEKYYCSGVRKINGPEFDGHVNWMLPIVDCAGNPPEYAFELPKEVVVSGHHFRLAGVTMQSEKSKHFTAILFVRDRYVLYDGLGKRTGLTLVNGKTSAMNNYVLNYAWYLCW